MADQPGERQGSKLTITLMGKFAKLKPEDARRIAVYVVRGSEVMAEGAVEADGSVRIDLARRALATPSPYGLQIVVGPAGVAENLEHVPSLQRVALDPDRLEKGDVALPLQKIELSDAILKAWWLWCRWYCISGTVLGLDGCPVPGAQVKVYNVTFASGSGYTKTPRATVTTDANGHFTACFAWCTCLLCRCWPCWPLWWFCWPWWWEWDILHVIEHLESTPNAPRALAQARLPLAKPDVRNLMVGQGFAAVRKQETMLVPDTARTALIQRKLADPRLRAIFPWWWWCCDDPNIIFSVTQGPNTIVDEQPAMDTRWCLEDGSTVTLTGNAQTIGTCPNPKPVQGFVWQRVGEHMTVDHIHDGYADNPPGLPGTDQSDMAFTGTLYIYGEFAPASNVAYYQVNAGQWTGNPARGGTAPASSTPIAADLYNFVTILHIDLTVTHAWVKMGPMPPQGGVTNLYATQEQRPSVPAGVLPAFPAFGPGDAIFWGYNGLKVATNAPALIGGGNLGGVDLTVTGYDAAFAPVLLPNNPDDLLTLMIDNAGLTTAHINSLTAYNVGNVPVPLDTSASANCPAYHIGVGGYVKLNVTVNDANGHLYEYQIAADFGHGSTGMTTPGLRGYSQPPASFVGLGIGYQVPNTGQKTFGGGTEDITFSPTEDCCYDFRFWVGKRVTDGTNFPSLFTADFQTATLKVT